MYCTIPTGMLCYQSFTGWGLIRVRYKKKRYHPPSPHPVSVTKDVYVFCLSLFQIRSRDWGGQRVFFFLFFFVDGKSRASKHNECGAGKQSNLISFSASITIHIYFFYFFSFPFRPFFLLLLIFKTKQQKPARPRPHVLNLKRGELPPPPPCPMQRHQLTPTPQMQHQHSLGWKRAENRDRQHTRQSWG